MYHIGLIQKLEVAGSVWALEMVKIDFLNLK